MQFTRVESDVFSMPGSRVIDASTSGRGEIASHHARVRRVLQVVMLLALTINDSVGKLEEAFSWERLMMGGASFAYPYYRV